MQAAITTSVIGFNDYASVHVAMFGLMCLFCTEDFPGSRTAAGESFLPIYLEPLSYGTPSAFGAAEFFENSTRTISEII